MMSAVVLVGVGLCAAVRVGLDRHCGDTIVMAQNVSFEDPKLEVEYIEKLSFDAANIPLAEDPCAKRPVDVLKRRVIEILAGKHHCSKKNSLTCPLLKGDVQMWLGSINIDKRSKYDGNRNFCPCENVRNELCEFSVSRATRCVTPP